MWNKYQQSAPYDINKQYIFFFKISIMIIHHLNERHKYITITEFSHLSCPLCILIYKAVRIQNFKFLIKFWNFWCGPNAHNIFGNKTLSDFTFTVKINLSITLPVNISMKLNTINSHFGAINNYSILFRFKSI